MAVIVLAAPGMSVRATPLSADVSGTDELLARLEAVIPSKPEVVTPEAADLMQRAGSTKRLDAAMLLIRALAFNWHPHVRNESKSLLEMFPAAVILIHEYGEPVLPLLMYEGITNEQEWLQKRIALVTRELGGEQEIHKARAVFSLDARSNITGERFRTFLDASDLKIDLANPLKDQLEELEIKTRSLVVGIDAEELLRGVFPSLGKRSGELAVVNGRVAEKFSTSGESVELQYAIYPAPSMAKDALSRTMPQLVSSFFQGDRSEGFVSATAAHIRVDNMLLLLFPGSSEESAGTPTAALALLREAVARGQGIRRGAKVNTPRVKVLEVIKEETPSLLGRARVLFEPVEGDAGSLLLPRQGVEKRIVGSREQIEVTIERGLLDPEPILRLVRPTGEALELSVSQMLVAGAEANVGEATPDQGGRILLASTAAGALQGTAAQSEDDQLLARLAAVLPGKPAQVTPEITGMINRAAETKRLDAAVLLIQALAFNHSTSGSNGETMSLVGHLPAATNLHHHYGESVLPLLMYTGVTTDEEWLQRRIALMLRELYKPEEVAKVRALFSLDHATSPAALQLKGYLDASELEVELFNPSLEAAKAVVEWVKQLKEKQAEKEKIEAREPDEFRPPEEQER